MNSVQYYPLFTSIYSLHIYITRRTFATSFWHKYYLPISQFHGTCWKRSNPAVNASAQNTECCSSVTVMVSNASIESKSRLFIRDLCMCWVRWKNNYYKLISRLDIPVPHLLRTLHVQEHLQHPVSKRSSLNKQKKKLRILTSPN